MTAPVGVIPAAGSATRVAPLPCSKEILPIGVDPSGVRLACHDLLDAMSRAGAELVHVVLGDGKWDIPARLGDGAEFGLDLSYLTIRDSPGAPSTIDRAYRLIKGRDVLFGFPDILFGPPDALAALGERRRRSGADVVLGLFAAERPEKMDMVELDESGRVARIVIKPESTDLTLTWILAAWGERFTDHLHHFLARPQGGAELHVGDVIQAAIEAGMHVLGETFPDGTYRDIGTPEDLAAALRQQR